MTHQAKEPMNATNLSRSAEPSQLTSVHTATTQNRKAFFSHLTRGSTLPLRVKSPFSMIRSAGKSCNGMERRMAMEYKN